MVFDSLLPDLLYLDIAQSTSKTSRVVLKPGPDEHYLGGGVGQGPLEKGHLDTAPKVFNSILDKQTILKYKLM